MKAASNTLIYLRLPQFCMSVDLFPSSTLGGAAAARRHFNVPGRLLGFSAPPGRRLQPIRQGSQHLVELGVSQCLALLCSPVPPQQPHLEVGEEELQHLRLFLAACHMKARTSVSSVSPPPPASPAGSLVSVAVYLQIKALILIFQFNLIKYRPVSYSAFPCSLRSKTVVFFLL